MPATGVPPKLMDVPIDAYVRNMPGAICVERVPSRLRESVRSAGGVGQVVVVPAHD